MGLASWAVKLARRLMALGPGEYVIVLHKNGDRPSWQVVDLDEVKTEKS